MVVVFAIFGCTSSRRGSVAGVVETLNRFHGAASQADLATYFAILAEDGVFLGTDATERWTAAEFRAYCAPYFAAGQGWTYIPVSRHVTLDPHGHVAWSDEVLTNQKYGLCRGTSVLSYEPNTDKWRIKQYSLSFLIPNAVAEDVTSRVKATTSTP
jgi:hypothetical protein